MAALAVVLANACAERVPVHDALPESAARWRGRVRLDTDGLRHRVGGGEVETVGDGASFARAWFADPVAVPWFDLVTAGDEGCRPWPEMDSSPTWDDGSEVVPLGVGDAIPALAREEWAPGRFGYGWYAEDHPDSGFALNAGHALSLDGVHTRITVVGPLVLSEPAAFYADDLRGGAPTLAAEPAASGDARVILYPYREGWAGGQPPARGALCVRKDDGTPGSRSWATRRRTAPSTSRVQAAAVETPRRGLLSVLSISAASLAPG